MQFKIQCKSPENGTQLTVVYDTSNSSLTNLEGKSLVDTSPQFFPDAFAHGPNNPAKKSKSVRVLKIQLGLSCNYECTYCSQRYVPRAEETNPRDVDAFLQMLENIDLHENGKVEFWGGEPFVYWKTLKPLAEALREKYPNARFSIINNGSLLDDEKVDWLLANKIGVAISHDGPEMKYRGPDPLENEKIAATIRRLDKLYRENGMMFTFNSMLHAQNFDRERIIQYFRDFLGHDEFSIGEGGIVDAYDDDAVSISLNTKKSQFDFRRSTFNDMFSKDMNKWSIIGTKLNGFHETLHKGIPLKSIGQKCGMDRPDALAVTLRGEIITCQNTSPVSTNPSGETHNIGHITDIGSARLKTSTHLQNRENCTKCPVVHLCQGSCMFLSGNLWDVSCTNAFTENIAYLSYAIYQITGHIPFYIDADWLPAERRDIWGTILEHKEKKPFPVKVVAA